MNGRRSTSSQSWGGIPKALNIGESIFAKKSVMPLTLNNATAIKIEAMKGKMSTTSFIAPFAPLTKV